MTDTTTPSGGMPDFVKDARCLLGIFADKALSMIAGGATSSDAGRRATAETIANVTVALEQAYTAGVAAGREQAQQWRPISEAPKDGSDIIIYPAWSDGPNTYRSGEAHWHNGKRIQYWEGTGGLRIRCKPIHWQPLPPPPTKDTP